MKPDMSNRTIKNLISEESILSCYSLKPTALAGWRRRGLPYVKLGKARYAYWEDELVSWLSEKMSEVKG